MAKSKDMRCGCRPGYVLATVLLFAGGFWTLVNGFLSQLNAGTAVQTYPWYFAAFLLFAVGKMCKMQAGALCPVHGHN